VTDEIRKVPRSDFGKSIFPTFDVNVPMPSGTAAPAQSGAGQSSSGSSGNGGGGAAPQGDKK